MPKNIEIDKLDWPQRLRIMESLNVSNNKARKVFGVSATQIKHAKKEHKADGDFDALPYEPHFAAKKPGRRGTGIVDAYANVTETPQAIEEFAKSNGVSVAVLKQHNSDRFKGKVPEGRQIWTRKQGGVDSIWFTPVEEFPTEKTVTTN